MESGLAVLRNLVAARRGTLFTRNELIEHVKAHSGRSKSAHTLIDLCTTNAKRYWPRKGWATHTYSDMGYNVLFRVDGGYRCYEPDSDPPPIVE